MQIIIFILMIFFGLYDISIAREAIFRNFINRELINRNQFSLRLKHGGRQLQWEPPTTNVDTAPLTDLAGYKVYWGLTSGGYTNNLDVGLTTNIFLASLNLTFGSYYFVVTAYNSFGNESSYSNEVIGIWP